MASKLTTWINAKLKAKGTTATVEKKKASKYKSISAAKKAGSLYYEDKNGNPKIAATASDLDNTPKTTGVTRSLRPKLRPKKGMQPIVDPDGQNVGKDYYTNPEKIAGISREEMLKKINEGKKRPLLKQPRTGIKPPSESGGLNKTTVSKPNKNNRTALEIKVEKATKGLTGNAKKLAAWKAGERTLSMKERGRLYKWARSKGISVPKSLYDLPDNYK
tara:strand:+ start:54 stop:707 length:654 start_codon:yes stop_codon:yes gene_type:complete